MKKVVSALLLSLLLASCGSGLLGLFTLNKEELSACKSNRIGIITVKYKKPSTLGSFLFWKPEKACDPIGIVLYALSRHSWFSGSAQKSLVETDSSFCFSLKDVLVDRGFNAVCLCDKDETIQVKYLVQKVKQNGCRFVLLGQIKEETTLKDKIFVCSYGVFYPLPLTYYSGDIFLYDDLSGMSIYRTHGESKPKIEPIATDFPQEAYENKGFIKRRFVPVQVTPASLENLTSQILLEFR